MKYNVVCEIARNIPVKCVLQIGVHFLTHLLNALLFIVMLDFSEFLMTCSANSTHVTLSVIPNIVVSYLVTLNLESMFMTQIFKEKCFRFGG
jgi:hypothetical protein